MATVIESGIGALNYGKQAAKGTMGVAATTTVGYNRPKWFDGILSAKKTLGEEPYIDGQRFASPSVYTDKVGGQVGQVIFQVQPENAGLYMAQILGVDVVTGGADPYTHTITSAGTTGAWGTWWQSVGSAVGPEKGVYWDSKIAKLMLTVGREQKNMHYALDIAALNAAEVFTTAPAKTEDTSDPLLWTEVTGAVTFDGTVDSEANEEAVEIDTGMEPYWGDAISPVQLVEKKGTIVRTIKSIVTDATLLKYRKAVYNNTAPAARDRPVKDVFYADVRTVYTRSATRTMTINTPRVAVRPEEMAVGAQREGGEIEISFGGACLKNGATPALSVIVLSAESASYA
jgi:hypothetical protein